MATSGWTNLNGQNPPAAAGRVNGEFHDTPFYVDGQGRVVRDATFSVPDVGDKATFLIGIGGAVAAADDLANHYVVLVSGTLKRLVAVMKAAPAQDLNFDILRSRDAGGTWASVLTQELVLPASANAPVVVAAFSSAANEVMVGDLLRIDLKSGKAQDVTIVLWWS